MWDDFCDMVETLAVTPLYWGMVFYEWIKSRFTKTQNKEEV